MNLKTATLIALICTIVIVVISILRFIDSYSWYSFTSLIYTICWIGLAYFFYVLYKKQK